PIPVKADFLILNIVQLAIDDEGADDKANRNKKLKDHQAATEPAALKACGHRPSRGLRPSSPARSQPSVPSAVFQYINRLKGGKVESGVAACETANQQHQEDE